VYFTVIYQERGVVLSPPLISTYLEIFKLGAFVKIRKYFLFVLILFGSFFSGFLIHVSGAETAIKSLSTIELTDSERAWLADHPNITIGTMKDWPPLNFTGEHGHPQGIGADYIHALNKRLNGIITIKPESFRINYDLVKTKKLDALMDITPKSEREPFFNFTKPYLTIPHVIIGNKGGTYFNSEKDLAGKTVALEKGYYNVTYFRNNYPDITVKEYDSTSKAINAVSRGEADAYVGNRSVAMYLIMQELITNVQAQGEIEKPPVALAIGVRKDWPILADILNRSLADLTMNEKQKIVAKWIISDGDQNNNSSSSSSNSNSNNSLNLTMAEQVWLKKHPIIKVHNEWNWPPFNYNTGGQPAGFSIDYMNLLANRIGIEVQYVQGEWGELLEQAFNKKLDVMLNIVKTSERKKHLLYTGRYAKNPNVIIALENSSISDVKSLFGQRVAYTKGFFYDEVLKTKFPAIKRVPMKDTLATIKALQFGNVDAALGELAALQYQINENFITGVKVKGEFLTDNPEREKLNIAVRNDWPELQSILQKTMLTITRSEVKALQKKWLGDVKNNIIFSQKELAWLQGNPTIKMGVDTNWMPMEQINPESGVHEGIIADFIKLIAQRSEINFELVPTKSWQETVTQAKKRLVDVYPGVKKTEKREQYMNYSHPYLKLVDVIVMRLVDKPITGLKDLQQKRVGVVKDYMTEETLKRDYPELQIISVSDTLTGLEKVFNGELDAFVDDQLVVRYIISKNALYSLKVVAKTSFKSDLHITVRNDWPPEAISIINKAIATITKKEQNQILQRWISFSFDESKNQIEQLLEKGGSLKAITNQFIIKGVLLILSITLVFGFIIIILRHYFSEYVSNLLLSSKVFLVGPILLSVLMIIIIIITEVALETIEKQTRISAASSLQGLVSATHESLKVWIKYQEEPIKNISKDPHLIQLAKKLLLLPRDRELILKSDSLKKIREFFEVKRKVYGNIGFFIIAPDDISVGSMRDANIGTKNLIAEQRPALLRKAFSGTTVFIPPIRSDVSLKSGKITNHKNSTTMFFAAPLKDEDGDVFAVLATILDLAHDYNRLTQIGKIGSSGETYTFDSNGLFLSKSRFADQLQKLALISKDHQEILNLRISDPGGNLQKGFIPQPLSKLPLTLMAKSAISGKSGINVQGYRDYRGIRVLGTWVWDHDLGFGITTEIDEEEVLTSYYTIRIILVSVLGLTIFLTVMLTVISFWKGETDPLSLFLHPEDKDRILKLFYRNVIKGTYQAEYRLKAADDSWKWILSVGRAVDIDDNHRTRRVIGVNMDITERKHMEHELFSAKEEAEKASVKVAEVNKNIFDSIKFASIIQNALLPDTKLISNSLEDYFVIWKPKDIVGGDIFFFEVLRDKNEFLLFVIDCTGHGVPGAFVTALVKAVQQQVIAEAVASQGDISPAMILSYFNIKLKHLLKQDVEGASSNVGFDGGVLYYNNKSKIVKYVGAQTPLFYIQNNTLKMIKGDRQSIGDKRSEAYYLFKEHIIAVDEETHFFITTDGYIDQLGGERGRSFSKKSFKQLLIDNYLKDFSVQKKIYTDVIEKHRGTQEQTDDITFVGLKIG